MFAGNSHFAPSPFFNLERMSFAGFVANKIKGIRAAHVTSEYEAQMAKQHNDANILCLGSRTTDKEITIQCVEAWLTSSFEAGKHERRVKKIEEQ